VTVEVLPDAEAVARRAAAAIAEESRAAVAARGCFTLAVSGGSTPWHLFGALSREAVPWLEVHLFQVDERIVPADDPKRNLRDLVASLVSLVPLIPEHVHAMPVEDADLEAAAERYATTLGKFAGTPPVLDLIHLGLGEDGHTASLVPGDAALSVARADVALTGFYKGTRRMTLTIEAINRARRILWVVVGRVKAPAVARLVAGDPAIPAGRVRQDRAVLLADAAAAPTSS
jgi:6-phosphogluconolactonase